MDKLIKKLDVRLSGLAKPTWELWAALLGEGSSLPDWIRGKLESEFKARGIEYTPYQDGRKAQQAPE